MAANNILSVTSLDVDGLVESHKAFLRSQSAFKDYDFDGANISELSRLMALNTWQLGFFLNMASSERFNDSAQLRDSLVSKAKELNYLPRSATSATTSLNVSFPTSGIKMLEIPKGTQFSGLNATGNHRFVTDRATIVKSSNNFFSIANLQVYEGSYFKESFVVDNTIENQQFLLSNKMIDISSVTISVFDGNNRVPFKRAVHLYGLGPKSNVFFMQAASDYRYEVVFGDGIFGTKLQNGTIVEIEYRICTGENGNGIENFLLDSDLGFQNGGSILAPITIVSNGKSDGGAFAETTESIRFRAPRHFETQDRAINDNDYESLITENFPNIKSIHVYGGEEIENSVQYGRVFLVASTITGSPLSDSDKTAIKAFMKDKNSLGITPVTVDPGYIELILNITTHTDFKNSTLTPPMIKTLVESGVDYFDSTFLQRFNNVFSLSRFTTYLNSLDPAITSNEVDVKLSKTVNPPLYAPYAVSFKFLNKIKPGIISSNFISNRKEWFITDTVPGITNNGSRLYLLENNPTNASPNFVEIGRISYETGSIEIASLTVTDFLKTDGIKFIAVPFNQDVYAKANEIVEIDFDSLNVEVTSE